MGKETKIGWTDRTQNFWIGCTKVHAGCANCYAEREQDNRHKRAKWGPHGTRHVTSEAVWNQPYAWNEEARKSGRRIKVFCSSLSDFFESWDGPMSRTIGRDREMVYLGKDFRASTGPEDRLTMADCRRRAFKIIDETPWLDWQILTKRPENIRSMWADQVSKGTIVFFDAAEAALRGVEPGKVVPANIHRGNFSRPNVWLGTSVSDQASFNKQVPELLNCCDLAPVRFLSMEPLLGPVDILYPREIYPDGPKFCCGGQDCGCRGNPIDPPMICGGTCDKWINWIIVGGESGPNARGMHPRWVREIVADAVRYGIATFFKQWGEYSMHEFGAAGNVFPPMPAQHMGKPMIEWNGDHFVHVDKTRTVASLFREGAVIGLKVGKDDAGNRLDDLLYEQFPKVNDAGLSVETSIGSDDLLRDYEAADPGSK